MVYMNVKKVFLHVGMAKTGTTSIQDTLFSNQELLKKNDYYYFKDLYRNHSYMFVNMFDSNPEKFHSNIKKSFGIEKIKEENERNQKIIEYELSHMTCENIIFSAEIICTLERDALERIKAYMIGLFPNAELKIVIATRESISYINSVVQQRKKTGNNTPYKFRYKRKFSKLIQVFSKENIIAYKFEDACLHEKGPVGFFLDILGLDNAVISKVKVEKSNESVSDRAVEIIEYINSRHQMLKNDKLNRGRLHLDYAHFYCLSGKKYQIDFKELESEYSLEAIASDKKWLRENLGIDYTNVEIKSIDNENVYDNKYYEEFIAIFKNLPPVIKKLSYDFISEEAMSRELDSTSMGTLSRIKSYIENSYGVIINNSLDVLIDEQEKTVLRDEKLKVQLIKRISAKEKRNGEFLRDIALFLEEYGMIEVALEFMEKAKMYSPKKLEIDEKIKEYKAKIPL